MDVIVANFTQASLAAQKATKTKPIVMLGVGDPIGVGLIASLAHPGRNITGTSSIAPELAGKRLELLKEIVPNISHIAALWNPANPVFQELQLREIKAAAQKIGIALQLLTAQKPSEFASAFAAIDRERTRALVILNDPLFAGHVAALADFASKRRLATIFGERTYVDAGGLMAYGPSYFDLGKRTAVYVDKILKGAKPADLPVEQPTTFEFVVSLKTAKALGLTIPETLLATADEVIQ